MRTATEGVIVLDWTLHLVIRAVCSDMDPTEAACAGVLLEDEVHHLIRCLGEELLASVHAAAGDLGGKVYLR